MVENEWNRLVTAPSRGPSTSAVGWKCVLLVGNGWKRLVSSAAADDWGTKPCRLRFDRSCRLRFDRSCRLRFDWSCRQYPYCINKL